MFARFLSIAGGSLLLLTTLAGAQQPVPPAAPATGASCDVQLRHWKSEARGMFEQAVNANLLVSTAQDREQQLIRERDEALAKLKALQEPKEPAAPAVQGTN